MAFFVAFYSYKGGVGRSLALANAAWSLAARGKRVALLDLDLEAPGLQDIPEFSLRGSGAKKGFLEYAASYRKRGWCPEITRYVHPCKVSPGLGKLWLMPSGVLGAAYQQQLGSLPWKRLHPKKGTVPFIEEFRKALVEGFKPDYILIDSRTGLSDIGGLSTHRLADMVVLVFNLTRPSIEGSIRAYRSFTAEGSRIQTIQLVASPVPPLVPGAGSLVERRLQQAENFMPLSTAFGRALIRIDYDSAMVLAEELAVRSPDGFQAATRYEALREAIQRANPAEVFPILEQAHELRTQGKLEDSLALLHFFTEAHPENAEGYLELGNFLFEVGRAKEAAQAFRRTCNLAPDLSLGHRRLGEALVAADQAEEAIDALEKAERLGDRTRDLYRALAQAYASKQEPAKEIEARRKAMLAAFGPSRETGEGPPSVNLPNLRKDFVEVLSRRPPYPGFAPETFWDSLMMSLDLSLASKVRILRRLLAGEMRPSEVSSLLRSLREEDSRWPEVLGSEVNDFRQRLADEGVDPFSIDAVLALRRGDRVDSAILGFAALDGGLPFDRRIALLEEAVQQTPENYNLLETFGQTLLDAAKQAPSESRRSFLEKAAEIFSRAANRESASHTLFFNWGYALGEIAALSSSEERGHFLREASSKYQQALQIKPDTHEALNNWGLALAALADVAEADEKRALLQEAASKFQQALQIKPDKYEALNNWGAALAALAGVAEADEKRALLQEATSRYQQALQIKPDTHEALNNWGLALAALARLAEADEKRAILQEATSRYQQALQIKPDLHAALANWAAALLMLADLEQGEPMLRLATSAAELARQANKLIPGTADYNLACALSRLEQFDEAASLLQGLAGRKPGLPSHALDDPDLQPLWAARPELRKEIEKGL